MCKSISEGGQRCAAHTRPKYEAATFGTLDWDEAAAAYASTRSGRKALQAEAGTAVMTGDTGRVIALQRAIRFGDQQREVAKAVRATIEQARQNASDPLGINRAWERHEDNKALGRGQYEYDEAGNVVFDPYEHDGNTATGGAASHMGPDEMAAWVADAAERERIDREFWIGSARRNPDNARRTLEAINPELAARFDWTTGTYLGD